MMEATDSYSPLANAPNPSRLLRSAPRAPDLAGRWEENRDDQWSPLMHVELKKQL